MNISEKETKKRDWFTNIMVVQTVISVLLILCLFLSAYSDGKFVSSVRSEYVRLMTGDITIDDISDALNKLKKSTDVVLKNVKTNNTSDIFDDVAKSFDAEVSDNFLTASPESESIQVCGGEDLQFTSIDTLEGICFDEYTMNFSMIVPLDEYEITSGFGYRISPITGNPGMHTGIDLATGYGSSIYASADGIVVDSAYDDSYGYYIKLKHPDNIVTIYAHCSSLCVDEGDVVNQGDVIAKVGSTGASTGNHLHFEMRKDNIRINPGYALSAL